LEKYPYLENAGEKPRYGIAHRLDKDTSGVLLVAKNNEAFELLQKQFKERAVEKKYLLLVAGHLENKEGIIDTLVGRSPGNRKKQATYLPHGPESKGKRRAITSYKVLKKFGNYDLVEAKPKTGRKHQIRVHFAHINHPIAGDKIYSFKNQLCPEGLQRQFLHASYIKIKLPSGKIKELNSELPEDLKSALKNVK
jgi:23S rRNA pseudouridine1911/1915/1917 synthase